MSDERIFMVESMDSKHGAWSWIGARHDNDNGLRHWHEAYSEVVNSNGEWNGRRIVNKQTGEVVFPIHEREDSRADLHELKPDFIGFRVRSVHVTGESSFWHCLTEKQAIKQARWELSLPYVRAVVITKRPLMFVSSTKRAPSKAGDK
jgi:hypothetical protein